MVTWVAETFWWPLCNKITFIKPSAFVGLLIYLIGLWVSVLQKYYVCFPPPALFHFAKNRTFVSRQFIVNLLMCQVRPKLRTAVNMLAMKFTKLRPVLKQCQLLVAFEDVNVLLHLLLTTSFIFVKLWYVDKIRWQKNFEFSLSGVRSNFIQRVRCSVVIPSSKWLKRKVVF